MSIIEFLESPQGVGSWEHYLSPIQTLVLKLIYNEPLTEDVILYEASPTGSLQTTTEREYVQRLRDTGRLRGTWGPDISMVIGRQGGKSLLTRIIIAYETHKALVTGFPGTFDIQHINYSRVDSSMAPLCPLLRDTFVSSMRHRSQWSLGDTTIRVESRRPFQRGSDNWDENRMHGRSPLGADLILLEEAGSYAPRSSDRRLLMSELYAGQRRLSMASAPREGDEDFSTYHKGISDMAVNIPAWELRLVQRPDWQSMRRHLSPSDFNSEIRSIMP